MNLGELEFTVSDMDDSPFLMTYEENRKWADFINQRLKEKLAKCEVRYSGEGNVWFRGKQNNFTLKCRVVCIEPLEPPDSMEKLIEDLANDEESNWSLGYYVKRARKLKEKGGE